MSKDTIIKAKTDAQLKAKVEKILDSIGLTPSEAVNIFYHQILLHNGLPFEVKIPNQTTRDAMNDTTKKIGASFDSIDDLLQDLNS
jgi:DNA-damage-inducible protein J